MTAALAAFALPAGAATKSISFSVSPATLSTTTTAVYATINNTGNSNANSFEVDWLTSPNFVVSGATTSASTGSCSTQGAARGALYSRCIFTQQLPTKTQVIIKLNVTVTAVNQCVPPKLDWFAYAWTGAPGPASQSFLLAEGAYTTALPSSAVCTISFVKQPKDAFIGAIITSVPFDSSGDRVSVQLQPVPATPTNVSVSAATACAITGSSASATTDTFGVATFTTLSSNAASNQACQLTASATGYTSSPPSDSFNVVLEDGVLGCGSSTDPVDGTKGAQAIGTRLDNTTGGCGPDIPYTLIWRDVGNTQELQFVKDDLGQAVAMSFSITWPNEPVPTVLSTDTNPPTYGVLGAIKLSKQEFVTGQPVPIDLCVGTPTGYEPDPLHPGESLLTGLTGITAAQDLATGLPGIQYGCVYERRITYPATGTVGLREWIYLQGDWGAVRNI